MTTERAARAEVDGDERKLAQSRRKLTLDKAFREFAKHPTPWMIAPLFLGSVVARIVVGDFAWTDGLVPAVMIVSFPLAEWMIHVFILHWRPRSLGRLRIDTLLSRKHREHHNNPRDIPLVFIPWQVLCGVIPGAVLLGVFAFGRVGLGLTFLATLGLLGLAYEWTHYLIHTDYKPKSRLYRATWRNHRFHHYKNEHYWFTVTTAGTADRILGTYPDPDSVAKSPTARNLHAMG
ncbi:sterol desaturase family protein [Nocardia sp. 348MFTsu5.1]|uniref:sterol desaturase family protein n=1 Tax=Nocardia sp. 348MFTsu5.1 TaxID=1172185 RepID=UPI000375506B|nr:sterol desaturase family protein [Nocardia sp. 348MFTsu5.1]